MDLKYVARQLLRRPGHTLAVIACLVIGLVASVGAFSVITSLFYGDMPGIAGRRSLARVFLRYDSPTESESGGGGAGISSRHRCRSTTSRSCGNFRRTLRSRGLARKATCG